MAPPGTLPDPDAVAEEKLKHHRRWFRKFEEVLDGAQTGPLWLKDVAVAAIVDEALRHRDGKVYRLDAFCVMPSNVHVVFAPYLTEDLAVALAEKTIQARRAALGYALPADADEKTCQFVLASIMGRSKVGRRDVVTKFSTAAGHSGSTRVTITSLGLPWNQYVA
jgi:hypothetical protein